MKQGWVYVLTNQATPGLVKIGYTTGLPKDRAKALYGTGVAFPFQVMYQVRCRQYRQVEQAVHRHLAAKRVNNGREFFACSVQEAVDAIAVCVGKNFISDDDFRPANERRKKRTVRQQVKRRQSFARVKILLIIAVVGIVGILVWQWVNQYGMTEAAPPTRPTQLIPLSEYQSVVIGAADVNMRRCASSSCEVVGILPAHQTVRVHPTSLTHTGWIYAVSASKVCYPQYISADGNCQQWRNQVPIEGWIYTKNIQLPASSSHLLDIDRLF